MFYICLRSSPFLFLFSLQFLNSIVSVSLVCVSVCARPSNISFCESFNDYVLACNFRGGGGGGGG